MKGKRSYFRWQLEDYLRKLDVNAEVVFDIGGKQLPVATPDRTRSWSVKRYVILDLPEYNLDEPIDFTQLGQADMVFCLEVFDYLLNPLQAFQNLANATKPGGTILFSSPLVYPFHKEPELDSLRVTLTGIHRLAERAGLVVTKTTLRHAKTDNLVLYYQEDGMKMMPGACHAVTGHIVELQHAR